MPAEEEFALVVVFSNLLSAIWSYFCVTSSIDRTSRTYDFMHEELAWYALWYSCQTFALLVSVTNVVLVSYIIYRLKDSFVETIKSSPVRSKRTLLGLVGATVMLLMLPVSFVPYKVTMIQTSLHDENVS
ncbi:hypothetical protein EDC01DRAFT_781854 [Geopyxis carbonaria]|nr:hypothetical protein EDC01DRAFT_781854 [Geopyxis carbonaria]